MTEFLDEQKDTYLYLPPYLLCIRHVHQDHIVPDLADHIPGDDDGLAFAAQEAAHMSQGEGADVSWHHDGGDPPVAQAELDVHHPAKAPAVPRVDDVLLAQLG